MIKIDILSVLFKAFSNLNEEAAMKEKRERWDSRSAFILAAIGSAIGLGNVWRFPYIAYENGGGAFLIPYFFALLTAGIPILILEMAIGQRFQGGAPTALRKANKAFEFVGWYAILIASVITFYYCAIMAWSVNYLVHAFTTKWSNWEPAGAVAEKIASGESTLEEEFFFSNILRITEGPGILGGISPALLIGLAVTWILVYLCIRKGVQSVSKVVLITVPLPFLLLIILFFRGITLPGAIDGLSLYLTPDFSALLDVGVWKAAYGQVFFSLSVGFGVMIAYASFRPKNADVVNNGFITALANCGTSFFAGFAVFSVLGYMAQAQTPPVDVSEVVSGSIGLAFVTFPKAIALLPAGAVAIGIIFFLMLLTLGIDSAFSLVEAASTAFSDEIRIKRHTTTVILCVVGFLAGLLFITDGGLHWLDIVDHWCNDYGLVVVAFLEALMLGWMFNLKSLQVEIDKISEVKAGMWWIIMVKYVATPILGIILIWGLYTDIKEPYGGYEAKYLIIGGWAMAATLMIASFILSSIKAKPVAGEEEVPE